MKLYEDDLGLNLPPADSQMFVAPSSEGIGMSPEQGYAPQGAGIMAEQPAAPVVDRAPRQVPMNPRAEAFSKLSGLDKFFTAAGEFGAGVLGKPSPLNAEIKARREERLLEMEESKAAIDGLNKGLDLMEGLDGDARTKFAGQYGENLERLFPGTEAIFKAAADNPGLVKDFEQYRQYLDEPIQIMMTRSPREFRKWANSAEGIKALVAAKDRFHIRVALKKAEPAMKGANEFVPPEVLKDMGKDGRLAFSEFMNIQQYLPEKLRLSPSELEAVRADPKKFSLGANLIDPDTENEIAKSKATKTPPGAESPIGKINADLKAGRITQAQADAAIKKANEHAPAVQVNMPKSSGMGINPTTGEEGHYTIGADGTVRWDKVKPLPKPVDVFDQALADALAGKKPKEVKLGPEPKAGGLPRVASKAEFDNLKPGDKFIDSRDGKEKVKGK